MRNYGKIVELTEPIESNENAYVTENVIIGKGTEYELRGLLTIPSKADEDKP